MAALLSWLYGAGFAQGALLVAALARRKSDNAAARWFLVGALAVLTLLLGEDVLAASGADPGIGLGLAVEFAIAPLLYLFMRAVAVGGPSGRAWPHFLPLLAASLVLLWLNLGFGAHWVSLANPRMRLIVAAIVFVKIAYFAAYAVAVLRLPPPAEPGPHRSSFIGVRRLMILLDIAYGLSAASFIAFFARIPGAPDSDLVGGVVMVVIIYAIGYCALADRRLLDARAPYRTTPMAPAEAIALRARAVAAIERDEAYRDPEFGLGDLARRLGVGEARLSQALNAADGDGFHGLINGRRLEAYRQAAAQPANLGRTVLDLAFEAGFNSKATFYRAQRAAKRPVEIEEFRGPTSHPIG